MPNEEIVEFDNNELIGKKLMTSNDVDKLIYRIGQCTDYQCLYALEEVFNKSGLTIQTTSRNRMILCKLREGKPVSEHVIVSKRLVKRDNAQEYEHPTQKPITLCEKPMKRCTKAGDIILDLFGGSGSTLIAAEQLNRRAYMMECDPIFCDVIKRRYEEYIKR